MTDYLPIISTNTDIINLFTLGFVLTILLELFLRMMQPGKYILNITKPNVFVFEYEKQSKSIFSFYRVFNFLVSVLGYTLLFTAVSYYAFSLNEKTFPVFRVVDIFLLSVFYVVQKYILVFFLFVLLKKSETLHKVRHVRITFEVFFVFYMVLLSFLIFYFPIHKLLIYITILFLIAIFYIYYLMEYINSLNKHIKLKTYQLILYLCISEILPIMLVIYWLNSLIL